MIKTVPCPCGGIGRRTGLKILRALKLMPVQVRPWAPFDLLSREVAQLGSAPGLGPGGRRFESCLPDHFDYHLSLMRGF